MSAKKSLLTVLAWLGLAFGLTLASLMYLRPAECRTICDEPLQASCPEGSCRFGEQKAGFPLSMVQDQTGSSPTGGWGRVDPSDSLLPRPFLLNMAFYAGLLGFAYLLARAAARRAGPRSLLLSIPLLAASLVILAAGIQEQQPAPLQSAYPEGSSQALLLGNWRSAVRGEFVLRFYENGRLSIKEISRPDPEWIWGSYAWEGDQNLRLSFHSTTLPGEGLCTRVIPLLKPFCTIRLENPLARGGQTGQGYPAPEAAVSLPYPAPPPPVMEYNNIEADFQVIVTANELALDSTQAGRAVLMRDK